MEKDSLLLVNKLFNNDQIRTIWSKEEEKYYISVIDVIGILTKSKNPRHYWNVLKGRLKNEGFETVTNCDQLKLKASDGKYRLTDVTDIEGMFRIIESIPSKNAESIKQWLAHLGSERIDEVYDPSQAIKRAIDYYRDKGYDDNWIKRRIQGIYDRNSLTDIWKENGITKDVEYALLTNEIYKTWSGMTSKEYKEYKGLRKESLRDNMDSLEVSLTDISEEVTKRLTRRNKPVGLSENIKLAKCGGLVAKNARNEIESLLGESIIKRENNLDYQYLDNLIKDK